MKINFKNKFYILSGLFIVFLSLSIFSSPIEVKASTCTTDSDCASSQICLNGFCTVPNTVANGTGVAGTSCASNAAICGVGLTCNSSGLCAVPGAAANAQSSCQLNNLTGQACCNSYPSDPVCVAAGGLTSGGSNSTVCPSGLTMQNNVCLPPSQYTTGIAASTSLSGFILSLIKILLTFAGLIAVVMLVLGGYWYMAAGGNAEMAEKGQNTILNFVIGLVIIIMAYTLVSILASTLTGGDPLIPK